MKQRYQVSDKFKQACKEKIITGLKGRIHIVEDDIDITESDNLVSFEIKDDCYTDDTFIGSAIKRSITVEIINPENKIDLEGKEIEVYTGKEIDGVLEEIPFGNFIINKPENAEVKNKTTFTGYDYMVKFNTKYVDNSLYPITLKDIFTNVCNQVGVEVGNTDFPNNTYEVTGNPFTYNEQCTEVLKSIAKLAGGFVSVGRDNKIYIKTLSLGESVETIDGNVYFDDFTKNEKYGAINTIVLGLKDVEGENVVKTDPNIADKKEIKIVEQYFMISDEERKKVINALFDTLNGLEYLPFSTKYYGLPYLDKGDKIEILDNEDIAHASYILNHTVKYNGAYSGEIKTEKLSKTEEKIKNTTDMKTKFRNVELSVDKINGKITSLIEEVDDVSAKTSSIEQTVDEIALKVEDTENLTAEVKGFGQLELPDCKAGNLLELHIKGDNKVFDYMYPNDMRYPSDDLYPSEGSSVLSVSSKNKLLTIHDEWKTKHASLDATLYTGIYLSCSYSSSDGLRVFVEQDSSGKVYYLPCEPNTKYILEIESGTDYTFGMASFENDVFEKLNNSQDVYCNERFDLNTGYSNGNFITDETKKIFEITTGSNDAYIFIKDTYTIGKNFIIYKESNAIYNALISPLTEVDENYSYFASLKGNTNFSIYDVNYFDENKALIASYSTFFNPKILKGLTEVPLIFPLTTKYIQIDLREIYENETFGKFTEYDLSKIQPMLEKVEKFIGNATYSGELWSNCIQMNEFYNNEYYVLTGDHLGKATNLTEIELNCRESESTKTDSALFGTRDGKFAFYSSQNNNYNTKLFQYNGIDYEINTISKFLNINYILSFKYNENNENYVLRLEDETGYYEEFIIPKTTEFVSENAIGLFVDEGGTESNMCFHNVKKWENGELTGNWVGVYYKHLARKGLANIVTKKGTYWNSLTGPKVDGIYGFKSPETAFHLYHYQEIELGVIEPLRRFEEYYDEYVIKDGYGYELRRILGDGTIVENPEPTNKKELKVILGDGTNILDVLNYEVNKTARYVKQNNFTNFFATQVELKSEIALSANQIKLSVEQSMTDEFLEKKTIESSIDIGILEDEGYMAFKTNKITIDSNHFKLSADGHLTATAGTIGGWNINSNSLTQGLAGIRALTEDQVMSFEDVFYVGEGLGPLGNCAWSVNTMGEMRGHAINLYCLSNSSKYPSYIRIYAEDSQTATTLESDRISTGHVIAGDGIASGYCMHSPDIDKYSNNHTYFCHWNNPGNSALVFKMDPSSSSESFGASNWWISNNSSDERLKHDIENVHEGLLQAIDELEIKQFIYNVDDEHTVVGVIAQDFLKLIKKYNLDKEIIDRYEIVRYGIDKSEEVPEGYMAVDYQRLNILKIKCLEMKNQKLQKQINYLANKLNCIDELK